MAEKPGVAVGFVRQRVRGVWAYTLYLLGTMVPLALAYPQPGWWPLALVALMPASLLAVRARSWRRLAWTAWLLWSLWWLWMLRWVTPVTMPGYVALCVVMALYTTAALLLTRWLVRGCGVAAVLAVPMGWVSLELLRGHWPAGGFGWFSLGHAMGAWLPEQGAGRLVQVADLGGELTVSFLVAMTSGLLVDVMTLWRGRGRTRSSRRRRGRVAPSLMLWLVVCSAALIYGEVRVRQTAAMDGDASGVSGASGASGASEVTPRLRVAAVQTDVPQDNKIDPDPQQAIRDWQRLVDLTDQAAVAEPGLVVWPETVVPAYLDAASLTLSHQGGADWHLYHQQMAAIARDGGFALVAGAPAAEGWEARPEDAGRMAAVNRHNSAFVYHKDGTRDSQRYDKMHLVPFGEYIPWVQSRPWLRNLFLRHLSPYAFDYTLDPGRAPRVFTIVGPDAHAWRLATPICIEDAVPRVCRAMVWGRSRDDSQTRKRVDVLVNLTNDAWYRGRSQRPQHLQIATLRCIENRVSMVRSVNTGVSAVIDSAGRIVSMAEGLGGDGQSSALRGQYTDGVVVGSVYADGRVTLYGLVGDGPIWGAAALTLALALAGWLWRGRVAFAPMVSRGRRDGVLR